MKGAFSIDKLTETTRSLMDERFGGDNVIALATTENGKPFVRYVNAHYADGAFYVITYALSNKMRHIADNPAVSIAGDWFTATGNGVDMGYFGSEANRYIADRLRKAFAEWIDNGHNDFSNENTHILCLKLTDGVLFSHGTRYDIDFT